MCSSDLATTQERFTRLLSELHSFAQTADTLLHPQPTFRPAPPPPATPLPRRGPPSAAPRAAPRAAFPRRPGQVTALTGGTLPPAPPAWADASDGDEPPPAPASLAADANPPPSHPGPPRSPRATRATFNYSGDRVRDAEESARRLRLGLCLRCLPNQVLPGGDPHPHGSCPYHDLHTPGTRHPRAHPYAD